MIEEVVLVDNKNNIIGTMPKKEVHSKKTPLHRAFSIFIFGENKKLLIQQRSHKKKTWPLVWSNSCCGHPSLGESSVDAAKRRIKDELGIKIKKIEEISPYKYKFSKNGIMENEICPILIGFFLKKLKINKDEVEKVRWLKWGDFLKEIKKNHNQFSPWCIEQAKILNKNKRFKRLIGKNKAT